MGCFCWCSNICSSIFLVACIRKQGLNHAMFFSFKKSKEVYSRCGGSVGWVWGCGNFRGQILSALYMHVGFQSTCWSKPRRDALFWVMMEGGNDLTGCVPSGSHCSVCDLWHRASMESCICGPWQCSIQKATVPPCKADVYFK